jgi:hypothetical protein
VTIEQVLRFVLLEERTEGLWKAINQTFKKVKIVEHYNNYYKLNIDRGEISIGNLFGIIENMVKFRILYVFRFLNSTFLNIQLARLLWNRFLILLQNREN